jgi:hypothetical protein
VGSGADNSSLGSQWAKTQTGDLDTRIDDLYKKVQKAVPEPAWALNLLNVKLTV